MRRIILALIPIILSIFLIAGCGSDTASEKGDQLRIEDLDKEKAKSSIVEEALDYNYPGQKYGKSDIVNIEVCEALDINNKNDGFTGKFITFWETSDGDHKEHFLLNKNYEVEKIANYDKISDRCVGID